MNTSGTPLVRSIRSDTHPLTTNLQCVFISKLVKHFNHCHNIHRHNCITRQFSKCHTSCFYTCFLLNYDFQKWPSRHVLLVLITCKASQHLTWSSLAALPSTWSLYVLCEKRPEMERSGELSCSNCAYAYNKNENVFWMFFHRQSE